MATKTKPKTKVNANRVLKDIASGDAPVLEKLLDLQLQNIENSGLDPRMHSMVRLAALVSEDAAPASYAWQLPVAMKSGVTREDVAGVLIALAPTVGMARVIEGAGNIARGLGIDIRLAKAAARPTTTRKRATTAARKPAAARRTTTTARKTTTAARRTTRRK